MDNQASGRSVFGFQINWNLVIVSVSLLLKVIRPVLRGLGVIELILGCFVDVGLTLHNNTDPLGMLNKKGTDPLSRSVRGRHFPRSTHIGFRGIFSLFLSL